MCMMKWDKCISRQKISFCHLEKGADLLYHETTFLKEKEFWAKETYHSTTEEAATIARDAGVDRLLIGHFSARYKDVTVFQEEAREVFENTYLAVEGENFEIKD